MKKKTNIAIIPARGGSKRIPKKNIRDFLGKPIIAYSIETALKSGLFDEVMVSTDDPEIVEIAKKYGAEVPFIRSKKNADDYAVLADVVEEVLSKYKKEKQVTFENVCCILPTAVFIRNQDIKNAYKKLKNPNFDAVFPVVRYSFPIQRAMQFDGEKIRMIWPENQKKRSQDLKSSYHDAGLFYWIKTQAFKKEKTLWPKKLTAIQIDENLAQDIDTLEDWETAELKYKILYQQHGKEI